MTDYSKMPSGTEIGRGKIAECPYCKRPGLVKAVNGKIFVTHFDAVVHGKEDEYQVVEDECPKEGIRLKSAGE